MNKVEIVDINDKDDLIKLGSAITWEGMDTTDDDELDKMFDHLATRCKVNKRRIYRTTGEQWNNWFNLTGSNSYPKDLTIVSISFEDCDVTPFIPVQMTIGGRWLDDIISNNEMRERYKIEER